MQPEAQSVSSNLPATHLNKGIRHANAVEQSATSSITCALAQSLMLAADAHRHLQRFLTVCGRRHAASVAELWACTLWLRPMAALPGKALLEELPEQAPPSRAPTRRQKTSLGQGAPGVYPWEVGAASGGLGRAGRVSLTTESPTFRGPVGLITVFTGEMLISAGAMFRPCMAGHALSSIAV